MKVLRSDCCEQPVSTGLRVKNWNKKNEELVAKYDVCIKCGEPCNAIEIEVEDKDEG